MPGENISGEICCDTNHVSNGTERRPRNLQRSKAHDRRKGGGKKRMYMKFLSWQKELDLLVRDRNLPD
jgi:hypothetical protein